MHIVTTLSYANSMLNPLLYAAFNENFRVGFARACRCLTGGADNLAAGTRSGGQLMTGRTATNHSRLRPTTQYEDRRPVAEHRIEVVEIVTVVGQMEGALDQLVPTDEARLAERGDSECDVLVAEPCSTSVDVATNRTANTTDQSMEETLM